MKNGTLYLLPTTLGENNKQTLPAYLIQRYHLLDIFIAERAKTARRFIKSIEHPRPISELTFFELNKFTDPADWPIFLQPLKEGKDTGVLSEAGCPGVADPGAEIVRLAHEQQIQVVPMAGPSSILLALMASGMNGQSFAFHGYLTPKKELLGKELKKLEQRAKKEKQTQIFMETPYRNLQLTKQAFLYLSDSTRFCIACDLTLPTEYIRTQKIKDWKKQPLPDIHKRPAIFLLL